MPQSYFLTLIASLLDTQIYKIISIIKSSIFQKLKTSFQPQGYTFVKMKSITEYVLNESFSMDECRLGLLLV